MWRYSVTFLYPFDDSEVNEIGIIFAKDWNEATQALVKTYDESLIKINCLTMIDNDNRNCYALNDCSENRKLLDDLTRELGY